MTHLKTFLIFGSILFSAVGAKADSIIASLYSPIAPTGSEVVPIALSSLTAPSQSTIKGSGYTITFNGVGTNQGVVNGSASGLHATPVGGVTSGGTAEYLTADYGSSLTTDIAKSGNYLSTGSGSITITFATPQTSLALLWGSIDTGNTLSLNDLASYVVTGTAVQTAAAGFASNGYQGAGGSAYVIVNSSSSFTTATFSSPTPSFEFSAVAASNGNFTALTPEPNSLLLIATGLLACGLLVRRYSPAT